MLPNLRTYLNNAEIAVFVESARGLHLLLIRYALMRSVLIQKVWVLMIKVLLVDDHELVRTSLKLLLHDAKDIKVIAEAQSGEEALRAAREFSPDVVLMDLNMPGMGGFEAVMRLLRTKPAPKILVLSSYISGLVPAHLLDMGASGYLSKRASYQQLMEAIHTVYSGGRYIDPSMANAIASFHITPHKNSHVIAQLTERELQILMLTARGMERGEIAESLFLSKKTVQGYLTGILKKLNARTDAEAVRVALESGLIDIDR